MRINEKNLRNIVRKILIESLVEKYWGIGGAGIIFLCLEDGTVFLQKRSSYVSGGGGKWAFPGGGIHPEGDYEHHWNLPIPDEHVLPDNSPKFYEKAIDEVEEECGSVPPLRILDQYIYEDRGFKYKTFIVSVTLADKEDWQPEAQEMHSWEVDQVGWFTAEEFSKMNLFFGFTPELISKTLRALSYAG